MKRRLFGTVALAAVALAVVLVSAASAAVPTYSNGFESDTAGWFDSANYDPNYGTITREASGSTNPAGYADPVASATGGNHARLTRTTCFGETAGAGIETAHCRGPFTRWGGYNSVWTGGYATQVDVYLDAAYAQANHDTYQGNTVCLLPLDNNPNTPPTAATDSSCNGTRFDYTSAINDSTGAHFRDFGFNVSTGLALADRVVQQDCTGYTVIGTTNVDRIGANPNIDNHNPQCIPTSGWYTFKHTFSESGGSPNYLVVKMEIINNTSAVVASWTINTTDLITSANPEARTVGCNRYGMFSNQEIWGLPIDNASMTGCGTPPAPAHIGVIAPTATTCQQYRDNATTPTPVLDQLLYTTKGTKINAVSPGVFFYYTKVSGVAGVKVDITEDNDATTAPSIPIQQGQVVLYDALTCKVVKGWTPNVSADGTATGTLPTGGDFIIGVKYSPSSLKGADVPNPTTVEYTFGTERNDVVVDESSIDLVPKA